MSGGHRAREAANSGRDVQSAGAENRGDAKKKCITGLKSFMVGAQSLYAKVRLSHNFRIERRAKFALTRAKARSEICGVSKRKSGQG